MSGTGSSPREDWRPQSRLADMVVIAHLPSMRFTCFPLAALLTSACSGPSTPTIDQLEVVAPGLQIAIDGQGNGRFIKRPRRQHEVAGKFTLNADQFEALIRRLEVYRRSNAVIAAGDFKRVWMQAPQCEDTFVSDSGGMTVHWIGPALDEFYIADYGCDPQRNDAKYRDLRAILHSLPVPEPEILP